MGLAQARAAIDEQWVVGRAARFARYLKAALTRYAVALALDEVVEGVVLVELRLDLPLLQSWDDEGVDWAFRKFLGRGSSDGVLRVVAVGAGHLDSERLVGAVGLDTVVQLGLGTEEPLDGHAQQVDVFLFQPLVEEIGGHEDGEHLVLVVKRQRDDGLEPCRKALRLGVVLDHREAFVPYFDMAIVH